MKQKEEEMKIIINHELNGRNESELSVSVSHGLAATGADGALLAGAPERASNSRKYQPRTEAGDDRAPGPTAGYSPPPATAQADQQVYGAELRPGGTAPGPFPMSL